ncbi:cbb3-type cytochrome oxidase assembly protein CcoS [Methylobacterium flocculans]|jgi:cbb3-type cytochrome oxidase maturation protein|nr:cbb3-type cytochrome oxidase assembly protein CcoS [Methylobacterium sp. FF17]
MNVLLLVIPLALALGGLGLLAFLWALGSGQYEDIEGAEYRVLDED